MHGVEQDIDWVCLPVSQNEHQKTVYQVILPVTHVRCQCTVPDCPGVSWSSSGLHRNFNIIYWGESRFILEEHPMLYPTVRGAASKWRRDFSKMRTSTMRRSGQGRSD